MLNKQGNRSLFGKQVPLYFNRLDGKLNGARETSVDPYAPDLLGKIKPPTDTPNAPWAWSSQGTAAVEVKDENTHHYYHDGPESPAGSRAIHYVAPNDGTTKVRIECTMRALITAGGSGEDNRFGICVGSSTGAVLMYGWAHLAGFEANEDLVLIYQPTDDTTTGLVEHERVKFGTMCDYTTLIMTFDPSTGAVDCKTSMNLGSDSVAVNVFTGTQVLPGTFDKIGIFTSSRVGYGCWANVHHYDWEEVA